MLRFLLTLIAAIAVAAPVANARSAPPKGKDWYYIDQNVVRGGFWRDEIIEMAERNVIRPSTQVFEPGVGWRFAKDTPALNGHLVAPGGRLPYREPDPQIETVPAPVAPPPPPPPAAPAPQSGSVQNELDAAMADHLVGRWTATATETVSGRAFETRTDYTFRTDGTYGARITTASADNPSLAPITEALRGRWSVRALSPDRFVLTLDAGTGAPPAELTLTTGGALELHSADRQAHFVRAR